MSIKSKDLAFDAKEPAFLRRLRTEVAGAPQQPALPRQKLPKKDDPDDAPTYVVEGSDQNLTQAEYEALLRTCSAEETAAADQGRDQNARPSPSQQAAHPPAQQMSSLGKSSTKRKAVQPGKSKDDAANKPTAASASTSNKKAKKKGKPIKLTFMDDDEGG